MLEQANISQIKALLKTHPDGMTISEIFTNLKMNRYSLAKYLEILEVSGQVESRTFGTARVFLLSHRVPVSALLKATSHRVIAIDEDHTVVLANDNFLKFFSVERDAIIGRHVTALNGLPTGNGTFPSVFSDLIIDRDHVMEIPMENDTGTIILRVRSIPSVFEDGGKGVMIVVEDVTREKKCNSELMGSEARYRAIVEDQTEFITRFAP